MTKPMPTGCIKENPPPSWCRFNLLLKNVDLDDKIGHLFVVDIKFDEERATEREYVYNECLPPIIEKQKIVEANERSVYQLLELFSKTSNDKAKSYECTAKSHATLFPKKFIPLYLEDLKFLITRCCCRVTKIHSHYAFEQARFNRKFVLMNQKSRQNAKNAIEKYFYKLMNNANFGYNCRNNANNPKFEPIIDEISEIAYIKKYYNLFDNKVSNFVTKEVLELQIGQDFQQQITNIKHDDPFRSARINSVKNSNREDLDALDCFKKKKENRKRENSLAMLKQKLKMHLKTKK